MCGLVGFLSGDQNSTQAASVILTAMADQIKHRGPDDSSIWTDCEARIGLGFRRLSIVDLSVAGRQPMISASGRYVITFNGEIYNHNDLRKSLAEAGLSPEWRGHSDTETLLASIEAYGLQNAIERCIGMFALVLWDRQTQLLSFAVDRMGEKPLYYGWQGQGKSRALIFGSELAALQKHPAFEHIVDRNSLCLLVRHGYIPAPYSIFKGICKLEPGHILAVSIDRPELQTVPYWQASKVAETGLLNPFSGSPTQATDQLETLLKDAVGRQMEADVPLGAFLSGGIDSSTIVALMQEQSTRPVKTFTIGFHEQGYDEAVHAKAIAAHLGTEHSELYVTPQQVMNVIPDLPKIYSEPFADSSQLPTFLVSKLAGKKVTVSLSGDAGDELFAGYNRYVYSSNLWSKISKVPLPVRKVAKAALTRLSPDNWDKFGRIIPGLGEIKMFGDKVHKGARAIGCGSIDEAYMGMISHQTDPASWVIDGREPPTRLTAAKPDIKALGDVERMMLLDSISYLPGDILVKLDRASMGASIESRVPFLDHRVFEFAWTLPLEYKIRNGISKWILREVLYRRVPRDLIERPKSGFGIPLALWLRGPLRDWAEELLDEKRLEQEGFFHPIPIRTVWKRHLSGTQNHDQQLWCVLMFQAWLEYQTVKNA